MNPRRIWGFLVRDLQDWISYKYEVCFWIINTLVGAVTYSFLGSYVALQSPELIEKYGGSFLAFLLVGMSYNYLIYASLDAPRDAINPWNLMWNMLIPASLYEVVVGSVCFRYLVGVFQFVMYLLIASAFGVVFNVDILSTIIAIALGVTVMWGLGMVSAGVQIITKRWDPVTWFFTMLSSLLSGVWFPYELLPPSLLTVSRIMPQRYILEMLRSAMLRAEPITALWESLVPLLISALIFLLIGSLVYSRSVRYAKEHGTVGEY
jgi:ABC-2 type transport system permease protein